MYFISRTIGLWTLYSSIDEEWGYWTWNNKLSFWTHHSFTFGWIIYTNYNEVVYYNIFTGEFTNNITENQEYIFLQQLHIYYQRKLDFQHAENVRILEQTNREIYQMIEKMDDLKKKNDEYHCYVCELENVVTDSSESIVSVETHIDTYTDTETEINSEINCNYSGSDSDSTLDYLDDVSNYNNVVEEIFDKHIEFDKVYYIYNNVDNLSQAISNGIGFVNCDFVGYDSVSNGVIYYYDVNTTHILDGSHGGTKNCPFINEKTFRLFDLNKFCKECGVTRIHSDDPSSQVPIISRICQDCIVAEEIIAKQ